MLISRRRQATMTLKNRAAIRASGDPVWRVAQLYGISKQTVCQRRSRDSVHDRSHIAHRLQTMLTPAREAVAVALRESLLLLLEKHLSGEQ